jgi:hypothetical protein
VSDVAINMTVAGYSNIFIPIGISLTYGYNMIPQAVVNVDIRQAAMSALCNFDAYRRQPVYINIKTPSGCLVFEGLADGLSLGQQMGRVQLQLVVKNKFQTLTEILAKFPGITPNSLDIFSRPPGIVLDNTENDLAANLMVGARAFELTGDVISLIVGLLNEMLNGQTALLSSQQNTSTMALPTDFLEILASNSGSLATGRTLLSNINMQYAQSIQVNGHNPAICEFLTKSIINADGNIFDLLISMLSQFNCALVIGNDVAFVVPEIGFMKVPKPNPRSIGSGAMSSVPNIIYPAQYDSISFNDNGYKDIKACYIYADTSLGSGIQNGTRGEIQGGYVDPNATGGVFVTQLPYFMVIGAEFFNYEHAPVMRTRVANRQTNASDSKVTVDMAMLDAMNQRDKMDDANRRLKEGFINNWAQLQYLNLKYKDRTGSINMIFNPRIAPGAVGSVYTRVPGTFIDFYVTGVNHTLSIEAPNTATANTSVSFNCGRLGAGLQSQGIDGVTFFGGFNGADSLSFATDFSKSIRYA